ncbi:MAG TPA: hypothetical protein ENJ85_05075 [Oceanithermus profundus]|uniref:Uncharacterized protein n=1 Tax=Oceanithermus profundus TaxID=187137 RepID=A0A7C5SPS9_9DEIN|nr:hypothetical protein [Oceanithermus profundus]
MKIPAQLALKAQLALETADADDAADVAADLLAEGVAPRTVAKFVSENWYGSGVKDVLTRPVVALAVTSRGPVVLEPTVECGFEEVVLHLGDPWAQRSRSLEVFEGALASLGAEILRELDCTDEGAVSYLLVTPEGVEERVLELP